MILAHGPLGYLIVYGLRKRWTFPRRYYWFGIIGGIFPDIDLFYFYWIDSSRSHHQLITHSLIPYIGLWLVGLCIPRARLLVSLFALGCISHILTDVLTGYVAVFQPISQIIIGWPTNGWLEIIIILLALGTLLPRRLWLITSGITVLSLAIGLTWLGQHSYKPNGELYYSDADADGILNLEDRDLDGDGLVNMIDDDIDNDGQDNSVDFYLELFSAEGALFDYSFGHFVEVPLRVGLVNDVVLVHRTFANVGLFISQEMTNDYADRPSGYRYDPTDNRFTEDTANMLNWLQHTQHALPADAPLQEFDIVFFQSGQIGIFTRVDGQDVVLDVDLSHPLANYQPLDLVSQREQGIQMIGRILPKPYHKRY